MLSEFLTWENWNDLDELAMNLHNVEVIKDFGPMKKGDNYSSVAVFYHEGRMEIYKEVDAPISFIVNFGIVPIYP